MTNWRDKAKASGERKLAQAQQTIDACESALHRVLSDGEKRDLLKDNYPWDSELVAAIVAEINRGYRFRGRQ